MSNPNKFNPCVVIEASPTSIFQENSFVRGRYYESIHSKKPVETLKIMLSAVAMKLIRKNSGLFRNSHSHLIVNTSEHNSIHPLFGFFNRTINLKGGSKNFLLVALIAFAVVLTSANYSDAQVKSLAWQSGNDGKLIFESDQDSYPDQLGYIEWQAQFVSHNTEYLYTQVIETDPSGVKTSSDSVEEDFYDFDTNHIDDNAFDRLFKGGEYPQGSNLKYGTWFNSRSYTDQGHSCNSPTCRAILFRPNSDNINNLLPGQTVTSELEATRYGGSGSARQKLEQKKLVVTITRIGIRVNWDSNIELDNSGNPAVSIDPSETVYADLLATLSVVKAGRFCFTDYL